jgi:hypothetical protein
MRTRSASLAERTGIYVVILICLAVNGGIWWKLHSEFVVKRADALEALAKAEEERDRLQRTAGEKMSLVEQRRKEVDEKKRKDEIKKREFETTLDVLNKTLVNLPPIEVWPDLIKKIEMLASDLKVKIPTFTPIENKDLKSNIKKDFTEFYFKMELEGEYSKILEFLWHLENSIQLKKAESATVWKAIIKVVEGGFEIASLRTPNDTMKLVVTLNTFFRGAQ